MKILFYPHIIDQQLTAVCNMRSVDVAPKIIAICAERGNKGDQQKDNSCENNSTHIIRLITCVAESIVYVIHSVKRALLLLLLLLLLLQVQ